MKLAVLIPVYNAARYLRECLDSVLAEAAALHHDGLGHELMIFCCDDGSVDDSLGILKEYASRFQNMRFVSQSNSGVSRTRNRLMDELPPDIEAFAFLDSDDYILPGMYRKLVDALTRTEAEVAETMWNGSETVLNDMTLFLLRRTAPGRWINVINKLYRRSAVGSIRFREGLKFEEDYFFNFEIHQKIHRKVLVPGDFYYYRPNPESATNALNLPNYFVSASRRLRLSVDEFLHAQRIPAALESAFCAELAKDAYRMCIRKNLKKNHDAASRRELFFSARDFLNEFYNAGCFNLHGLNMIQRMLFKCCLRGNYGLARLVAAAT